MPAPVNYTVVLRTTLALWLLAGGATLRASEQSWTKLEARLDECTQQHGYDRGNTAALGPHQLGEGERAWRECAYDAVRTILIPDSGMDDAYQRVIVQDKTMTDRVEKGEMTRAQRQDRLAELIEQLHAAEEKRAVAKMEKTHAEFLQRVDEMRQMRRLNSIMR